MMELGRNEPCHCGSGRKYKKCCLDKDEKESRTTAAEKKRQTETAKDAPEPADTGKQETKPVKERGVPFAGSQGFREQSNRSGRSGIPVAGWSRSSTGNR